MSNSNPPDPQKTPDTNIFTSLIDAFKGLHPALAFGGLITIVVVIALWLLGTLPTWVLVIPVMVLLVFLALAYNESRTVHVQHQLELQQQLKEKELELERLKIEQAHDRASQKDAYEHERELAKLTPTPAAPPAPPKPDTPAEWPTSYLRQLQKECGRVNMAAIDPRAKAKGARAELSLQAIFTELDVPRRFEKGEELTERDRQRLNEEDKRQPVLQAISQEQRLVLKGAPGAGKSTLVRYVALCLAGEALGDEQSNTAQLAQQGWELPSLWPVRVILRDYAARGLPHKQTLWQFIVAELQRKGLAPCHQPLEKQLKEKGGLLMLDGLDEVPEAHQRREGLRNAVAEFCRDFPRVRVLVTTRPYAYENKAWHLDGFAETELLDFSPEQIEQYIGRWYTAAGTQDPDLPPDRAEQYAQQLQREVKYNPNLRELAQRPLLLALMVSLHRSREGGALPHKRVQLYDESVNLLLDLWQRPKIIYDEQGREQGEQLSALTELGINQESLRRALSQLAYEVHHDQPDLVGTADITHEKLIMALTRAIPKEKRGEISQDKIALYVRDRAGLLEDRGEDIYGFPHRTFQEYLAAMHLLAQNAFPDNLVALARQDPARWREAVLLAGNSITAPRFLWTTIEALYQKVAPPPAQPSEADFWGGFLAGQLLADSDLLEGEAQTDEAVRDGVREWQVAIVTHGALPPRDRAAAGDVLAALGDPRPGIAQVDEMELCLVPAGPCWLGNDKNGRGRVYEGLNQPYWLGRTPVTVGQWRQFVAESGHTPRNRRSLRAPDNRPVIWVNWYDAVAFCGWLTERWQAKGWLPEGYVVALPSEAEWEKGARGGIKDPSGGTRNKEQEGMGRETSLVSAAGLQAALLEAAQGQPWPLNGEPQRRYPWGNEPEVATGAEGETVYRANCESAGLGQVCAVGSFPLGDSPVGCAEMSGQVWEWTRTMYGDSDPTQPSAQQETMDGKNKKNIVLRGGSFYNDQNTCSARDWSDPDGIILIDYDWGFRVCVSPFSPSSSGR